MQVKASLFSSSLVLVHVESGRQSESYLSECLHCKEMALRSWRRQFRVVEDLYLKGTEKEFVTVNFLKEGSGTLPVSRIGLEQTVNSLGRLGLSQASILSRGWNHPRGAPLSSQVRQTLAVNCQNKYYASVCSSLVFGGGDRKVQTKLFVLRVYNVYKPD